MLSHTHTHLRGIIDDLERYGDKIPPEIIKPDLVSVIEQVFSFLSQCIDVSELEVRLVSQTSVDEMTLANALKILKETDLGPPYKIFPDRTIDPNQVLNELEKFFKTLISTAPLLEQADVIIRLEWGGDRAFDELLLCAAHNNISVKPIEKMIIKKLESVPEEVIARLWERVLGEFAQDRRIQAMVLDNSIMDKEFLKFSDIPQTRIIKPAIKQAHYAA